MNYLGHSSRASDDEILLYLHMHVVGDMSASEIAKKRKTTRNAVIGAMGRVRTGDVEHCGPGVRGCYKRGAFA